MLEREDNALRPLRLKYGLRSFMRPAFDSMCAQSPAFGITMVELLVALLILAEIATFTIPKVLSATGMNSRYAKAQEALATITDLTYSYAQQNGGCFPGNLTCKFNPTTGTPQDGLAATSSRGQTSYDNFETYLDSHLNYVEKSVCGTIYSCWTLPNGATYGLTSLKKNLFRPGNYGLYAQGTIYLDTTIAQRNAGEYSLGGVDADANAIYTYANGGSYGGFNNWNLGTGAGAYSSGGASIFDLKDHPGDTCVAVGGSNCGL
jgi:type II secretory pathway pseudopilin PulG